MERQIAAVLIVLAVFGMAVATGLLPGWSQLFAERKRTIALVAPAPPIIPSEPPVASLSKPEPEQWCATGRVVGGFCVIDSDK